jgi:purine-cytosine permease-like protein
VGARHLSYAGAVGVQNPFVNTALYVGPMVKHPGGADISWLIGLVLSGALYYVAARRSARAGDRRFVAIASRAPQA